MFRIVRRWMKQDPLRNRIEESIREGIGLHRQEWLLQEFPVTSAGLRSLAEEIIGWCADTIANTRRPYGIDHMSMAIACAHPGKDLLASATFGLFRPLDFYKEGGTRDRVEEFVVQLGEERLNASPSAIRFAAALFSWGDVAKATLFQD